MNNLTVISKYGKLLVDSRDVAVMVDKRHSDLLRDIKGYKTVIEQNANLRSDSFFVEDIYTNENNQSYPCYLLTRKGCDMVANKMTGAKGILFTAEYVTKFEEMEKQIKNNTPQLSKEIQAIFALDERTVEIDKRITGLEENMPLFNVECKELQALVKKVGIKVLGGYKSKAYNDNSVRSKVYKDIQQQLKREFGIVRYEAIKRCQLDVAKEIVNNYKTPLFLADEITLINDQISFLVRELN